MFEKPKEELVESPSMLVERANMIIDDSPRLSMFSSSKMLKFKSKTSQMKSPTNWNTKSLEETIHTGKDSTIHDYIESSFEEPEIC